MASPTALSDRGLSTPKPAVPQKAADITEAVISIAFHPSVRPSHQCDVGGRPGEAEGSVGHVDALQRDGKSLSCYALHVVVSGWNGERKK